jgi:hypothetical protein
MAEEKLIPITVEPSPELPAGYISDPNAEEDENNWTETIYKTGAYEETDKEWLARWNSGEPIPIY